MKIIVKWITNRLIEPSTWKGIVLAATGIGFHFDPAVQQAIITLGLALFGLIHIIEKEKK